MTSIFCNLCEHHVITSVSLHPMTFDLGRKETTEVLRWYGTLIMREFLYRRWSWWAFCACTLCFRSPISYRTCEIHARNMIYVSHDDTSDSPADPVLRRLWTHCKTSSKYHCILVNTWSRIIWFIWSKQNLALAKLPKPSSFSTFGIELHCLANRTVGSLVVNRIHSEVAWNSGS